MDFSGRRWIPLPGARSAPGAAPEAPPGGSSADPRNPRGPPRVHVYVVFASSIPVGKPPRRRGSRRRVAMVGRCLAAPFFLGPASADVFLGTFSERRRVPKNPPPAGGAGIRRPPPQGVFPERFSERRRAPVINNEAPIVAVAAVAGVAADENLRHLPPRRLTLARSLLLLV